MENVLSQTSPEAFDSIQQVLAEVGPHEAAERLCKDLRATGDYHGLFYAMLLKKRLELGVSPFPTGPSTDLPAEVHEPYENAIREAAREVGGIYLQQHDFPRAWGFFRLIGEPGPVRAALENYQPGENDDTYAIVDIAWHQQVHPRKGFDIYLSRHGICSTITMVGGTDLTAYPELRTYCYGQLVRTLYVQLVERLRADLEARNLPLADRVAPMLRDEIFGDDIYHIDISHLSSVVQMALQLPPTEREVLEMAQELSAYGQRLASPFRGDADAPFEETYDDYTVYLKILTGVEVEAGLRHFEAKIERELEEGNTFPAEIYVNLLLKLDRKPEALQAAKKYLATVTDERGLSCPSVSELGRQIGDFESVAQAARAKNDLVSFLAGLISQQKARVRS